MPSSRSTARQPRGCGGALAAHDVQRRRRRGFRPPPAVPERGRRGKGEAIFRKKRSRRVHDADRRGRREDRLAIGDGKEVLLNLLGKGDIFGKSPCSTA